nr:PREDICTED: mitogen-activated protein kinase kinase kinase 3-like [Apteryx mantelli mantelli]
MDAEEALNSIMKDLAALGKCGGLLDNNRNKNSVHSGKQQRNVRIKFEYEGEKRIIQFPRPVKFKEVVQKVTDAFGQTMDLVCVNNELLIPLKSQEDLDKAMEHLELSPSLKSLRILVSAPKKANLLQPNNSKQHEMRISRSMGDIMGSLYKDSERTRKYSTDRALALAQSALLNADRSGERLAFRLGDLPCRGDPVVLVPGPACGGS